MKDSRDLLTNWLTRIQMALRAHYRSSVYFARANYWVGIPVVVLSTVVGSSVFAALNDTHRSAAVTVAFGAISLIAAILASIQTFLRFPERAEHHRSIAVRLSELKKDVDQSLAFFPVYPDDQKQIVQSYGQRWTQIINEAPTAIDHELKGGAPIETHQEDKEA